MAKRSKHGVDRSSDQKDNPIGLTGAFGPVSVDDERRYDDPVGLTQAFGPVSDANQENWDTSEKWEGFDWSAPVAGSEDEAAEDGAAPAPAEDEPHAEEAGRARHARHAAAADAEPEDAAEKAAPETPALSPRMERSRRTRKRLVVTVILLLIVFALLGVAGYRLLTGHFPFVEAPIEEQQAADSSPDVEPAALPTGQDSVENAVQIVDIPKLTDLFGDKQADAIAKIGHGAIVTSSAPINDKETAIKQTVTVELADEPGNPRSGGTPKVYLGLDKDDTVVQVGYSAPAGSLGYDTLNFSDAVASEHIIERTLQAIGAPVEDGAAALPDDPAEYTTYAADGTTVVKERYSFDGDVDAAGIPCSWSAVLSYDYTSANISGNASETVRLIYVYLTDKEGSAPELEPESDQADQAASDAA